MSVMREEGGHQARSHSMGVDKKGMMERLRLELTERHGAAAAPQVESVTASMAPLMIREGFTYREVLNALNTHLYNSLQAPQLPERGVAKTMVFTPPIGNFQQSAISGYQKRESPEAVSMRQPPLRPKEKVADEWGAVIQHQAEMERELQGEEKRLQRERQRKYKEDLDRQYSMSQRAQKKRTGGEEGVGAFLGLDKTDQDRLMFERRRAAKEEQVREMQERHQQLLTDRERERSEKNDYERFLKRMEVVDVKKREDERERRREEAHSLRNSYLEQEQTRRFRTALQREMDLKMLEEEKQKWPIVDIEKRRFKDHVDRAECVERSRMINYQTSIHDRMLQQQREKEEVLEKMRVEKERKDQELSDWLRDRKKQEVVHTKMVLEQQLGEKERIKRVQQRSEEELQLSIQSRLDDQDHKSRAKQEAEARKKLQYKDFLQKQIEDAGLRKKLEGSQMSEHERRLNLRDIEAFATQTSGMHSKIVGMRSSPIGPQEKYIARQYGFGDPSTISPLSHGGYMAINPMAKKSSVPNLLNAEDMKMANPVSSERDLQ